MISVKLLFTTIGIMLFSCISSQKQIIQFDSQQGVFSLLKDTLDIFEAAGDITLSIRGERYRGKIVVTLHNRTNFSCDVYSPFAQTFASVTSDEDSAIITIGEGEYRIGVSDNLSTIPFFLYYPFIFNDFIRILTGRTLNRECFTLDADSVKEKGRRKIYEWLSDSLCISMLVSNHGKKIKSITYTATKGHPWRLECSSFRNGVSKEIYFESQEKNYFSLVFDRIRF